MKLRWPWPRGAEAQGRTRVRYQVTTGHVPPGTGQSSAAAREWEEVERTPQRRVARRGVPPAVAVAGVVPPRSGWFARRQSLCNDGSGCMLRGELGGCSLARVDGGHEGTLGTRALGSPLTDFLGGLFWWFFFFLLDLHREDFSLFICFYSLKEYMHAVL